jgi:two-component SAPR family response regulator
MGVNTNTVLRAVRLLRDEGLLELRQGRGIRVVGTPDRSVVLTKIAELIKAGQQRGYTRAELALHPEGATVDQIADSLLPDIDIDRARNRRWQSATEARRVLGDAFRRDQDGRYALGRGTIRIDVDELDRLLDRQQDQESENDCLEEALSLLRGVPLAGADWPWAEHHARNLRTAYVDILARVGQARLEAGNPRGALSVVERGIQFDELNEALWRLAMRADHTTGLRSAVSRRYETLNSRLQQQVGHQPSTETRLLYRDLLGQH